MDNCFAGVLKCIDEQREEIIGLGERIYENPETGFKEFKTSGLAAAKLKELGLPCVEFGDIPGVKATFDTGRPGPGIAVIGELDAVINSGHPHCCRETGAAHACGHNIQIAALLGAAGGLLNSGEAGGLCGKIHFMAVPAEECIEVEYRLGLKDKGVIRYLGGKPELLYRGAFDDVDMCMMVHSANMKGKVMLDTTSNGCIVKKIRYLGKAAHAGGAPHEGINALYAANLALMAINSLRETFREADYIRVHPIITKGGDVVNVIPSEVTAETFVRGRTLDAILDANKKVDRALAGSAIAMGAKVEILDIPGYFPLTNNGEMNRVAREVITMLTGSGEIEESGHTTGSTDLGDLSALMPVIQLYTGGVEGGLHSSEFRITDPNDSYVFSAKLLACLVIELLKDNACKALSIIHNYDPFFKSRESYFEYADGLFRKKVYPNETEEFRCDA